MKRIKKILKKKLFTKECRLKEPSEVMIFRILNFSFPFTSIINNSSILSKKSLVISILQLCSQVPSQTCHSQVSQFFQLFSNSTFLTENYFFNVIKNMVINKQTLEDCKVLLNYAIDFCNNMLRISQKSEKFLPIDNLKNSITKYKVKFYFLG